MQDYVRLRGAELVTMMTDTQREAVRAMVELAVSPKVGMTADALGRMIRPTIGLTAPQAKANLRCMPYL